MPDPVAPATGLPDPSLGHAPDLAPDRQEEDSGLFRGASRPAILAALRERLDRIDAHGGRNGGWGGGQEAGRRGRARGVALGVPAIDAALPAAGLARPGMHEIAAAGPGDVGAATGFLLALLARAAPASPVLWCRLATGDPGAPYPPGLARAGLAPGRLVLLAVRRGIEALWAAEEALRQGGLAVVAEVDAIGLTEGRRLQLAAEAGGSVGLLLRRADAPVATAARAGGGAGGRAARPAGVASTRWRVAAAPSAAPPDIPGVGPPRWAVALERARGGGEGSWTVEWDDATNHLAVVAGLADRAAAAPEPDPDRDREGAIPLRPRRRVA